jgi:hypothetical protein
LTRERQYFQLDKYSIRSSKLTLPHARQDTVKSQHYAIIGRTLLLRDCPLRSQPLLVLPWTTNEQGNRLGCMWTKDVLRA